MTVRDNPDAHYFSAVSLSRDAETDRSWMDRGSVLALSSTVTFSRENKTRGTTRAI